MMDLTPRSNPVDADVCRQGLPQVEHSCLQLLTHLQFMRVTVCVCQRQREREREDGAEERE